MSSIVSVFSEAVDRERNEIIPFYGLLSQTHRGQCEATVITFAYFVKQFENEKSINIDVFV